MADSTAVGVLFARLQLSVPKLRTVLIAAPRSAEFSPGLGKELAIAAASAGLAARLLDLTGREGDGEGEAGLRVDTLGVAVNLDALRRTIDSFEGFTVVQGAGLLDHPGTILAVPCVDAVVVVAARGTTTRGDLEAVRQEVERAGGRLVGVVLK
ncbi:MAG: hypothetical protein JOZ41_00265 [Chloroflexi bacterium]|nr:hypothetical protein [Chloroflexota bacterium]